MYLCCVKKFYRSVKIPDQVGVDVGVIAGLTGNLLVFKRFNRIAP